jgi:hypothetical protein
VVVSVPAYRRLLVSPIRSLCHMGGLLCGTWVLFPRLIGLNRRQTALYGCRKTFVQVRFIRQRTAGLHALEELVRQRTG